MSRRVDLDDYGVHVRYAGLDAVLTLVRNVVVPYDQIVAAEVGLADAPSPWTLGRVGLAEPVTGWRRGRFWAGRKRFFLDLRDPRRALVLRVRPGARWDVVAIEVDGAAALADAIRARIS